MLKFIIIDSEKKEVREVEHKEGSDTLKIMQDVVGGYIERALSIGESDVWVDEDGLHKNPDSFFFIEGGHQPFAGNGIVTGVDEDGDTVSATVTLEEVKSKLKFLSRQDIMKMYR